MFNIGGIFRPKKKHRRHIFYISNKNKYIDFKFSKKKIYIYIYIYFVKPHTMSSAPCRPFHMGTRMQAQVRRSIFRTVELV